MIELSKRRFEQVVVRHILDEDADLSYLEEDYPDEDEKTRQKYQKQDRARLHRFHCGEWCMMGISVEIRKQTSSQWADGGLEVGRSSLWGIESDSNDSYIKDEENNLIREAMHEVDNLRQALCG